MKWISVQSSALAAAAYDHNQRHLYLKFHSGDTYRYSNVPPEQYEELLAADSKGQYFRQHILGHFDFQRISHTFRTAS